MQTLITLKHGDKDERPITVDDLAALVELIDAIEIPGDTEVKSWHGEIAVDITGYTVPDRPTDG